MKLAVRVENALPPLDSSAPEPALVIATRLDGRSSPSSPCPNVPSTRDVVHNPDPLVARVGDSLRRSGWDIKTALRTLLLSDEFRRSDGRDERRLVRSPAEVVAGTLKALVSSRVRQFFSLGANRTAAALVPYLKANLPAGVNVSFGSVTSSSDDNQVQIAMQVTASRTTAGSRAR